MNTPWIELTRTNARNYNGPLWINADLLCGMQRISDERGVYTSLTMPSPGSDGGFTGFDVEETPEAILTLIGHELKAA